MYKRKCYNELSHLEVKKKTAASNMKVSLFHIFILIISKFLLLLNMVHFLYHIFMRGTAEEHYFKIQQSKDVLVKLLSAI